jgi:hypothetical protein
VGSWEEKPNQKGLALQEYVTPLYKEAGQWVVEDSELDGSGFLITSLLSDYRRQSFLRLTLGRVVDRSTGGAGLYPHGCGLYLEKSLLSPLALSRSVGADTAYSQDQSQDRQWEARNYRWKLRILYVAVSPFEYHQGDLQYVASYRRRI